MKTELSISIFRMLNHTCLSVKTLKKTYNEYIHLKEGDGVIIAGYDRKCSGTFLNTHTNIVWYTCGNLNIEYNKYDDIMSELKEDGWK